jgi:tetrapyrrole methylase family protein / MazG family protein
MGITIVGLGPGNGRFLTRQAWDLLTTAEAVYLRTSRHPAVADLPPHLRLESFDHVYETAEAFTAVYATIVSTLLALGRAGEVLYAVPGHPLVGEATVTQLLEAARAQGIPTRLVAGLSFVEPTLTAVGVDALDGLQIFDALALGDYHYPPLNVNAPLLLGQVYSRLAASQLKLALMAVYPDEHGVFLVHAAGEADEQVEALPLYAIDRSAQINHLTSLYAPPLPVGASLPALAETVAMLRSPQGCPWDQEQTPQSMRVGFLEEAYEALEALDADDPLSLCEELGDLLYHLVMQAQMASEAGEFSLTDVIAGIEAKLKRRHPHVWGDWQAPDTAAVLRNWELLKQAEKKAKPEAAPNSLLDNVPAALPALARSQKIQGRVGQVGFDWPGLAGVFGKLHEELAELQQAASPAERQAELGDVLFTVVNVARWLDVDAESALREANLRFARRFRIVEQLVAERGLDWQALDLAALDKLWEEAKSSLANDEAPVKVGDLVSGVRHAE